MNTPASLAPRRAIHAARCGIVAAWVALCCLAAACSNDDGTSADGVASDVSGDDDAPALDGDAPCEDLCGPGPDTWVDTAADSVQPDPCPGSSGCACAVADDCDNGICLETPDGGRCATLCVDTCDPGFHCKQISAVGGDLVSVCVARWNRLCDPCLHSNDCAALTLSDSLCADRGDEGAFCATVCSKDADCPTGYSCASATSVEGKSASVCTRAAGSDGTPSACPCSPRARSQQALTSCVATSQVGGQAVACAGTRRCDDAHPDTAGLSPCEAAAPSTETCDGVDNDCDGVTDDGSCDDGNGCTSGVCAGTDGCVSTKLDSLPCDADANLCTDGDTCVQGVCVPGAVKSCDDGNPCTKDACAPATGCSHSDDDGAPCSDDNPCTQGDACASGGCQGGVAKVCSSGQPCVAAACNLATGQCAFSNAPTGKACDDADACTTDDACAGGVCTGLPLSSATSNGCDDGDPCTTDACNAATGCTHAGNTGPCDDGNGCTVADVCGPQGCVSGKPKDCDDSNPCTADTCAPSTGDCVHDGKPLADSPCDADGSVCTAGDACLGGSCKAGKAVVCDDLNPCTNDSCDAKTGCSYADVGSKACDDGDLCTVGDVCTKGSCSAGSPKSCDDGNPCTQDACIAANGSCSNDGAKLSGAACDADGSVCTVGDACDAGSCKAGKVKDCDDANACTNDSCDAKTGCSYAPVGSKACDDGNSCTEGDVCSGGTCKAGGPKSCDDGNPCTAEGCVQATGKCGVIAVPDGTSCGADGAACKAGACVGGCTPKAKKVCQSGNVFWQDSCGTIGDLAQECGASEFCSQASCGAGNFNGSYLVTADPDSQPMGLLGTAKFPPSLYTFTDAGGGKASTSTVWAGVTYTYSGTLTGKAFDGAGSYTEGDIFPMTHKVKVLFNFAVASPATGKQLPDTFTGYIYETIDTGILGTINLIWKVTGVRQ